jgi:hypothetical protein
MLRARTADGARFLAGLAAGSIVGGLLLALTVFTLGQLVRDVLPPDGRVTVLIAVACLLGVADLVNRTPHVWRQVPQRLIHRLPSGSLGLVWGVDIGLMFTTQKTVSLGWAAIAAAGLLDPGVAPALLAGMAVLSSLALAIWSAVGLVPSDHGSRRDRMWQKSIRRLSGAAMIVAALITGWVQLLG